MAQLSLKKLVGNKSSLGLALYNLLDSLQTPICISDAQGQLILGQPAAACAERAPVLLAGQTIGWVAGDQAAAQVAGLLEALAQLEAEKKDLAREVLDRYRELSLLYHLSELLAISPKPEAIAQTALEAVSRLIEATAGVILLQQNVPGGFTAKAATGPAWLDETAWLPGGAVYDLLLAGRAYVANRDPAGLYLGEQEEPLVSVMCAPLKTEHRLLGAILLVHAQPDCYTAGDLKLLNAIALQVGPALEIAALTQVALEKARMERELQMAREVQITLLPEKTPVLPCWEFATYWQPAREVAGDYYDFIPETDGQLGMVIADVADKGIGAALFMVFTRSALRASLDPTLTPGQAVQKANRLMCAEADNGLFTTLFYARLDPATGQAACVNAGHNPAILCRPSSGEVRLIRRTGMALGVMEEAVYEQTDLQLAPGDFLLLYTDGVTEAVDEAFHEFGMERLLQTVNDVRQASPREILTALAQAVEAHTGGAPPMDDVTLVIARRV